MRLKVHGDIAKELQQKYPTWTKESVSKLAMAEIAALNDRRLTARYEAIKLEERLSEPAPVDPSLNLLPNVVALLKDYYNHIETASPQQIITLQRRAKDLLKKAGAF